MIGAVSSGGVLRIFVCDQWFLKPATLGKSGVNPAKLLATASPPVANVEALATPAHGLRP